MASYHLPCRDCTSLYACCSRLVIIVLKGEKWRSDYMGGMSLLFLFDLFIIISTKGYYGQKCQTYHVWPASWRPNRRCFEAWKNFNFADIALSIRCRGNSSLLSELYMLQQHDNLSFGYTGKDVLNHISFTL